MVAEFAYKLRLERAIEDECVPVAFVHVIAWQNGIVVGAEFYGTVGIALEIGSADFNAVVRLETKRGEHLALHFVNEHVGTEGGFFGDSLFGYEVLAEFVWIHRLSLTRLLSDSKSIASPVRALR